MALVDWTFGLTWEAAGIHAALIWWAVAPIGAFIVVEVLVRVRARQSS